MNLKEEMEKHQWFENTGEPTGDIPVTMAVILAKKYAESKCKKQRDQDKHDLLKLLTLVKHPNNYPIEAISKANLIDYMNNAPLATEIK